MRGDTSGVDRGDVAGQDPWNDKRLVECVDGRRVGFGGTLGAVLTIANDAHMEVRERKGPRASKWVGRVG